MNQIKSLLFTLSIAAEGLYSRLQERQTRASRLATQRGSLTLEQIIWTVALAVVALAIVAIVIAAINSKAAQLPL